MFLSGCPPTPTRRSRTWLEKFRSATTDRPSPLPHGKQSRTGRRSRSRRVDRTSLTMSNTTPSTARSGRGSRANRNGDSLWTSIEKTSTSSSRALTGSSRAMTRLGAMPPGVANTRSKRRTRSTKRRPRRVSEPVTCSPVSKPNGPLSWENTTEKKTLDPLALRRKGVLGLCHQQERPKTKDVKHAQRRRSLQARQHCVHEVLRRHPPQERTAHLPRDRKS